jgi:hypothetical protein
MSAIDSSMQAKGMQLQMGSNSPRLAGAAAACAAAAGAGAEAAAAVENVREVAMPSRPKTRRRFIKFSPYAMPTSAAIIGWRCWTRKEPLTWAGKRGEDADRRAFG